MLLLCVVLYVVFFYIRSFWVSRFKVIIRGRVKFKLHNCRYQIGLKLFSVPSRHKIYGKLF